MEASHREKAIQFAPGMLVRINIDREFPSEPRVFAVGRILSVDPIAEEVEVAVCDPFHESQYFENLIPTEPFRTSFKNVTRSTLYEGSKVLVNEILHTVIYCSSQTSDDKNKLRSYFVRNETNKKICKVSEDEINPSFKNGRVNPAAQLMKYEFQKYVWYQSRTSVIRNLRALDNSLTGFTTLAGSRIFLLPHQMSTIMRILESDPFRFMLADEVGLGKTIEALSVVKILCTQKSDQRILIVVPAHLKEQWKSEMFLKFNLMVGLNPNNNRIILRTYEENNPLDALKKNDLLILDEVHQFLNSESRRQRLALLSKSAENLLVLSATPVAKRGDSYQQLLKILKPNIYGMMNDEAIQDLINKQHSLIQKVTFALESLTDLEERIEELSEEDEQEIREDDDVQDIFEELIDELSDCAEYIGDDVLAERVEKISLEQSDFGLAEIKLILSDLTSRYQLESNFIRNRRKLLEMNENLSLPERTLEALPYSTEEADGAWEYKCLFLLFKVLNELRSHDIEISAFELQSLLQSFSSSSFAFSEEVKCLGGVLRKASSYEDMKEAIQGWRRLDQRISQNIDLILEDPFVYREELNSRLYKVFDFLSQEMEETEKAVLFTSNNQTFDLYHRTLNKLFLPNEVASFSSSMSDEEREENTYRFQNDKQCRFLICDESGGEGKNLQNASYLIHIDLPWDPVAIEQRIGRLDRIGRIQSSKVTSVVPYSMDGFEEELFKIWSDPEGLNLFNHSISGMEIAAHQIKESILEAIGKDPESGLSQQNQKIRELTHEMSQEVINEQNFDTMGVVYQPLFKQVEENIDYYNQNDGNMFAKAMGRWGSLTGFHGTKTGPNIISYFPSKFAIGSARKTFFTMPNWENYLSSQQSKLYSRLMKLDSSHEIKNEIRGTYDRNSAIANDYIHFFAPGDQVFDSIIDNAAHSSLGQTTALEIPESFEWEGFFFTYSLNPDLGVLLEAGLSPDAIRNYKGYLDGELRVIPYSIENPNNLDRSQLISLHDKFIDMNMGNYKHCGKRSGKISPLKEFKQQYPPKVWTKLVKEAVASANLEAHKTFKSGSRLKDIKTEMDKIISSEMARNDFYKMKENDGNDQSELHQKMLTALKKSKMRMESAVYIHFKKVEEEESGGVNDN
ncbi:MAG: DEAD/DEAH box helicase family protein [Erysipelotrichaceae bacterium]|nr:DEAD/DEAH box helicase family protein [Erysipelotrichaceae bacterium]